MPDETKPPVEETKPPEEKPPAEKPKEEKPAAEKPKEDGNAVWREQHERIARLEKEAEERKKPKSLKEKLKDLLDAEL